MSDNFNGQKFALCQVAVNYFVSSVENCTLIFSFFFLVCVWWTTKKKRALHFRLKEEWRLSLSLSGETIVRIRAPNCCQNARATRNLEIGLCGTGFRSEHFFLLEILTEVGFWLLANFQANKKSDVSYRTDRISHSVIRGM